MDDIQVVGTAAYENQTSVSPLGVLVVVIACLFVLALPRRWTVLPFLAMACFVSLAQRVVVFSLDFDFIRITVLFGIIRLMLRREYIGFVWKPIDKVVLLNTTSLMFFYIVHYGTVGAIINRLGIGFNALGTYFLFRCWIRDWADVDRIIVSFIWISIPEAIFFLLENQTGRNVFSYFGGVPEITVIRQGRLRCQGPFTHPILAGCFWASVIPLVATGWWKSTKDKVLATIGVTAAVVIVICCASSTPVLGALCAIIGAGFFVLRKKMRWVRWTLLLTLIGLHVSMKAPVWHLVSRVSAVGGSTGWHRYNLINQTIINFRQWWLTGCSTYTIASWGIWEGDVTNHYIYMAVQGGVVTLILFIAVLTIAYGNVGKLVRIQRRNKYRQILAWSLGVTLFVHCVNFIGITYFGQTYIILYLLFAIIGSLTPAKPIKTATHASTATNH